VPDSLEALLESLRLIEKSSLSLRCLFPPALHPSNFTFRLTPRACEMTCAIHSVSRSDFTNRRLERSRISESNLGDARISQRLPSYPIFIATSFISRSRDCPAWIQRIDHAQLQASLAARTGSANAYREYREPRSIGDAASRNFFYRSHKRRRLFGGYGDKRGTVRGGGRRGTGTLMRSYDMIMRRYTGLCI